jgi:hypothetical protein
LVGLVVEYKKDKMDEVEHHLRGGMTSKGARKYPFCHFCKKRRREKVAEKFKGYHSAKITKLIFQQLV